MIEQDLGEWQGLPHDVFAERLLHKPHPFWSIASEERPPGGESFRDVAERVGPVIERLVEEHAGGDVVIVAHGGSIRAAIAHAMEIPPRPRCPSRSRTCRSAGWRSRGATGASRR
jgi:broad specificity phosphatase PhoE